MKTWKQSVVFGIVAIMVLALSMIACGNGDGGSHDGGGGGGTFTVTGIPAEYNGKYAYFMGDGDNFLLEGYQSYNTATEVATFCLISNGSVSLPMWIWIGASEQAVKYSGNDTVAGWIVTFNSSTGEDMGNRGHLWESITFSNGSATKTWSSGVPDFVFQSSDDSDDPH